MTGNEYQALAMRTSRDDLTPNEHLINGVLGLAGEAGECADRVKKFLYQGHELDALRLAYELGDQLWYIAEAAHAIGYDLDTIMRMNIDKLKMRYPDGFSAERSLHRAPGDE